jgi:hypothetical protein
MESIELRRFTTYFLRHGRTKPVPTLVGVFPHSTDQYVIIIHLPNPGEATCEFITRRHYFYKH